MSGNPFADCSSLHKLVVDPANTAYCSNDNVIYTKDMKKLVCAAKNITHISIPDTVTEIEDDAFEDCKSLAKVRCPASLTQMSRNPFVGCSSLHTLVVDPANTAYCSNDNVIYTKDMKKLVCPAGGITHISIPDTVTQIDFSAFAGCTGITEVDLSACTSLTGIGYETFACCTGLASVDFSACTNLTEIGWGAFDGCTGLIGVLDLSACTSLTKIDPRAFKGCTGLASVDLSGCAGLTEIGWGAFDGCTGLTGVLDLSVCTNLTEIGGMAFKGYTDFIQFLDDDRFFNRIRIGAFCFCTGLTEVYLPASLTKIGVNAFSKCSNLHTLIVDPANKTYCSYDNVIYTKDMKTLVCAAGGITHISIPDTVIEIGKYVFEDISPDALFTVATEAVKQLLKYSESGIKDEQITVKGIN